MTDLRDKIREAVLHAECERPQTCPDCITDSVLSVVSADVERSARAARECARNTDAAASIIREALQAGHRNSAEVGMRVLYNLAAAVEDANLLEGLGLPATNPWLESEHDDGAYSECGTTEGDIWPIPGKPGYFCQACCIKLTGADPAHPA